MLKPSTIKNAEGVDEVVKINPAAMAKLEEARADFAAGKANTRHCRKIHIVKPK